MPSGLSPPTARPATPAGTSCPTLASRSSAPVPSGDVAGSLPGLQVAQQFGAAVHAQPDVLPVRREVDGDDDRSGGEPRHLLVGQTEADVVHRWSDVFPRELLLVRLLGF